MRVGQVPFEKFIALLSGPGLRVSIGPFNIRINTASLTLVGHLHSFYGDYKLAENELAEFHVCIVVVRSKKFPFSQHVRFLVDGRSPFLLFPLAQELATLEWGINLVIASRVNHLLLFHSAVVERNDRVILFPAWPGSGKTTLCTALVHRGYRLFSDEFGLMEPHNGTFFPIPRLMPLKNESIHVIRDYLPEAVIGHEILNTQKGTVAHVRPPKESIIRSGETAEAKWIIFPKWVAGSSLSFEPLPDSEAFLLLASNSFNYEVLGETGFQAVTRLISTCSCYKLIYSDFDDVIGVMNDLTN